MSWRRPRADIEGVVGKIVMLQQLKHNTEFNEVLGIVVAVALRRDGLRACILTVGNRRVTALARNITLAQLVPELALCDGCRHDFAHPAQKVSTSRRRWQRRSALCARCAGLDDAPPVVVAQQATANGMLRRLLDLFLQYRFLPNRSQLFLRLRGNFAGVDVVDVRAVEFFKLSSEWFFNSKAQLEEC